jgi:hypothetical protein
MDLSHVEHGQRLEARDVCNTFTPRSNGRGGQRRGEKWGGWIHGVAKQGLLQLVPAVATTIVINPPLGSPAHGPKQTEVSLGVRI